MNLVAQLGITLAGSSVQFLLLSEMRMRWRKQGRAAVVTKRGCKLSPGALWVCQAFAPSILSPEVGMVVLPFLKGSGWRKANI